MFDDTTVSHLSALFPIWANVKPFIPPYWLPVTNKSLVRSAPPNGANVPPESTIRWLPDLPKEPLILRLFPL